MPKKSQAHQLRIIGGQWRGRKLAIADIEGLRPTGDRIRETVFNWLAQLVPESHCIDLFAGSGALGLECLSRGAASTLLLEKHPQAAKQLKQHCALLNVPANTVIQADCLDWLGQQTLKERSIDIVFIDPPFAVDLWAASIHAIDNSKLLKDGAMIYIETPINTLLNTPPHWELFREKRTGQVCYRLYQCVLEG